MPPSDANQEYQDSVVRHAVFLLLLSNRIRRQVIEILNKTEKDIRLLILDRLRDATGASPANLRRAERLMKAIQDIRVAAWNDVSNLWVETFRELIATEVDFHAKAVELVLPVVYEPVVPDPKTLRALVTEHPFEGKTLKEWAAKIRGADLERIRDAIRIGVVQGETVDQIARRVVGTARLKGADGVTQITRNQALGIVRTAINAYSNAARELFFEENADIVDEELFVATLDARTTLLCRSLDGQRYKRGEGPRPPMHFACRSLRVAIFNGVVLGERPFKASTERQLLDEYTRANGLPRARQRSDLPHGHKGRYDEFARVRVREMIGRVPASTTGPEWFAKQSRTFQEQVMGKTKAKLFREGKLPLDRFLGPGGRELSLRDLARVETEAFRAAGLDPAAYL